MQKYAAIVIGTVLAITSSKANAGVYVGVNVGPQPVYVERSYSSVWVAPVTQTTFAPVWHPPVTETVGTPTWVNDRFEVRDVPSTDAAGQPCTVKQTVLVEPGHWQPTTVTRPGYWTSEPQTTVVVPGHWETVGSSSYYAPGPVYYAPRPSVIVVGPPRGSYGRPYDRGDRYRR